MIENIDMFEVLLGCSALWMGWLLVHIIEYNSEVINKDERRG